MSTNQPPDSYLNERRPPLREAMKAENDVAGGNLRVDQIMRRLTEKGFFSPRPRPWKVGTQDRGQGHVSYGILDRFDDIVIFPLAKEDAELIVEAVNLLYEQK